MSERTQGFFWMFEDMFVRHSLNDPTFFEYYKQVVARYIWESSWCFERPYQRPLSDWNEGYHHRDPLRPPALGEDLWVQIALYSLFHTKNCEIHNFPYIIFWNSKLFTYLCWSKVIIPICWLCRKPTLRFQYRRKQISSGGFYQIHHGICFHPMGRNS